MLVHCAHVDSPSGDGGKKRGREEGVGGRWRALTGDDGGWRDGEGTEGERKEKEAHPPPNTQGGPNTGERLSEADPVKSEEKRNGGERIVSGWGLTSASSRSPVPSSFSVSQSHQRGQEGTAHVERSSAGGTCGGVASLQLRPRLQCSDQRTPHPVEALADGGGGVAGRSGTSHPLVHSEGPCFGDLLNSAPPRIVSLHYFSQRSLSPSIASRPR